MIRLVNIESPLAGDVARNLRYARAAMLDSISRGEAPLASHLLYTQEGILDDTVEEERELGISLGLAWNAKAEATVVYADLGVSAGMHIGIGNARAQGRKVEYRRIGMTWDVQEGAKT